MRELTLTLVFGLAAAAVTAAVVRAQSTQAQNPPGQNMAGPPAVTAMTVMASAVPCSDLDRSIAFYTNGLGMTLGGRLEMGAVTEAPLILPGGGAYLMLIKPKDNATPLPMRSMLNRVVLAVPDVKAVEARLAASGYRLERPITEEPRYHVAVGLVQDPDGNQLELVQRTGS
jgi:catechol 2,3-dioxygenase-like lactoylglutathione lyase family enzyme